MATGRTFNEICDAVEAEGPHVFPFEIAAKPVQSFVCAGMTLREHFAGLAMQGMCANNRWNATAQKDNLVRESYAIADAMLAARKEAGK